MKAIVTRFKGPTNFRGSRIIASDEDGNRVTVPYDHGLSSDVTHRKAALALCKKMRWDGPLVSGSIKGGHVHVFLSPDVIEPPE